MEKSFLLTIAIILILTKLFGLFTRRIRMTQVLGAILAGLIIGPACLNFVQENDLLEKISELAVIFLLFDAGLQTDFKELKENFVVCLFVALGGVILPLAAGFFVAKSYNFETMQSLFIGVVLNATSVSITVETLVEMGKIKSKTGSIILGSAIIDDILGIIALTIMIGLNNNGGHEQVALLPALGMLLIKFIAFAGLACIIGWIFFGLFRVITLKMGRAHRLVVFAVAFCLGMAFMAEQFGLADITGAYVAGIILSRSQAIFYVQKRVAVLLYSFFTPIFFASIGLKVVFAGFNTYILIFAIILCIMAVLSKILGSGILAKFWGLSNRESLQIGSGMVSRGEVALVIVNKGMAIGILSPIFFSAVILVVVVTSLITPILLSLSYREKKILKT